MFVSEGKKIAIFSDENSGDFDIFVGKHEEYKDAVSVGSMKNSNLRLVDAIKMMENGELFTIILNYNWKNVSNAFSSHGLYPFEHYIPEWALNVYDGKTVNYMKLKSQVRLIGGELSDYLAIFSVYKKIAMVFGSQIGSVYGVLCDSELTNDYIMLQMPALQHYDRADKEKGIDKNCLKLISLLIYQPVSNNNRVSKNLASDVIISGLVEGCTKVSYPVIHFSGYFPHYITEKSGTNLYEDVMIEKMIRSGIETREIAYLASKDEFIDEKLIEGNLIKSFEDMKLREMECDVIISDFVEENYASKYLFFSPNRATSALIFELCKRILAVLGYSFNNKNENQIEIDSAEVFIYNSIKKYLNLTFNKDTFLINKETGIQLDLKSYVKYYVSVHYPEVYNRECEHETRDISSYIEISNVRLAEGSRCAMTINVGVVHLSLDLQFTEDVEKIELKIPKMYSPIQSYRSFAASEEGICKLEISDDGKVTISGLEARKNLIVDTTWNRGGV